MVWANCCIIVQADDLFRAHDHDAAFIADFLAIFQHVASDASASGRILVMLVPCYGDTVDATDSSRIGDVAAELKGQPFVPVQISMKPPGFNKDGGARRLLGPMI